MCHQHPELVLSSRIPSSLLSSIDYAIRIGDKNKWTAGSLFQLKTSHTSSSTEISIISSELVRIIEIPESILIRCGYKSQTDFQQQWEQWFQEWTPEASAWLIHFIPTPQQTTDEDISLEGLL
jgi:hypothetical protein